jgi:hypothetical protein
MDQKVWRRKLKAAAGEIDAFSCSASVFKLFEAIRRDQEQTRAPGVRAAAIR